MLDVGPAGLAHRRQIEAVGSRQKGCFLRPKRIVGAAAFLQPRVLGTRAVSVLHEPHAGREGDLGETMTHGVLLGEAMNQ
jgi:hypothetical protein